MCLHGKVRFCALHLQDRATHNIPLHGNNRAMYLRADVRTTVGLSVQNGAGALSSAREDTQPPWRGPKQVEPSLFFAPPPPPFLNNATFFSVPTFSRDKSQTVPKG